MLKRFFFILFCFQFFACANSGPVSNPSLRDTASAVDGISRYCSKLLATDEYQFKFDAFCAAREKYDKGPITAEHFQNWREMSAEEFMALIELHTQQVYRLTKGLERERLSSRKRVLLLDEVKKLQTSEKNVHSRIRKLVSFWYEATHKESFRFSSVKRTLLVHEMFSKLREKDILDRLFVEISTRGMIRVLTEAGMTDDPTWWEIEKRSLQRDHNIVQAVVALAFNSLNFAGGPFVGMLPEFNFVTASRLANEYENAVAEKGHEEALKSVLEKNKMRIVKNARYRVLARNANIAMFAAAIAWGTYSHHVEKQEANTYASSVIYGTIGTPEDTRPVSEKLKSSAAEFAEEAIKAREANGEKLTQAEKAEIYELYRRNSAAIDAEITK